MIEVTMTLSDEMPEIANATGPVKVEVRDYDWARQGDLDALPDWCELIDDENGQYVRYYKTWGV